MKWTKALAAYGTHRFDDEVEQAIKYLNLDEHCRLGGAVEDIEVTVSDVDDSDPDYLSVDVDIYFDEVTGTGCSDINNRADRRVKMRISIDIETAEIDTEELDNW